MIVHNMKRGFTNARETAYPGTQAVLRAVAILKAFTDARPEWRVTELARELDLNKTTAFRLLTALESEGMVVRNPATNVYRLGSEAVALGAQALRSSGLRALARPELERIARESGETATLEVLVGDEVLILDEVEGRFVVGMSPEIGTRWPAYATSTGKMLLAALRHGALGAPSIASDLPSRFPARTPRTITTRKRFLEEVDRIWKQGYSLTTGELEEGFNAIGAPVVDHDGRVIAALSFGGPRVRITKERTPELVTLVVNAAERVSRQLGGSSAKRLRTFASGDGAPPARARAMSGEGVIR